ncbi:hypothetical protein GCM10009555_090300 [Acrocarpospora macrocephala]|uniref:Uncharacterized protein n=1 Tax=Acrocarpospora macrocephala TaxID=150177 RepID=A0A5M3WK36_9ACTN|nr:hypothetical protein [Acrocarpospora macrocephala]GES09006.1 hypothetical protein Amac_026020 [Acrocarpospora macrocephala]
MPSFLGSLLAKAAVIALEAFVAHLVQVLIQTAVRQFAPKCGPATA